MACQKRPEVTISSSGSCSDSIVFLAILARQLHHEKATKPITEGGGPVLRPAGGFSPTSRSGMTVSRSSYSCPTSHPRTPLRPPASPRQVALFFSRRTVKHERHRCWLTRRSFNALLRVVILGRSGLVRQPRLGQAHPESPPCLLGIPPSRARPFVRFFCGT